MMTKMMISQAARVLRRRPILSIAIGGTTGSVGYAHYVEYETERRDAAIMSMGDGGTRARGEEEERSIHPSSQSIPNLPRKYDRRALRDYWSGRPVTVCKRLGQVVMEMGPRLAEYAWEFKVLKRNNDSFDETNAIQQKHAERLRRALTNLGPAWIKGGQQLSIRPDLVSAVVLKELQKLCDSVDPVPDEVAFEVLRRELRCENLNDIFDDLQLVATASLGQVYKAKLKTTDPSSPYHVAVKVQRPDMLRSFSLDLYLLQGIGSALDSLFTTFTEQAPYHHDLFDTFSRGSYSELDYEQEAANQILFREEFAKRCVRVKVPAVHRDLTTQRVLTTEWIDGVKLATSSQERIRQLIPDGVELFLTQLLDIGKFHADPHAANLLVTRDTQDGGRSEKNVDDDDNRNVRLCLIDFGLCADVDEQSRKAMTRAIVHLLTGDFDSLVAVDSKELGFLPPEMDTDELKPILTKILTKGLLEGGSNLHTRRRKLMDISDELNEIFFRYPFSVPPFFALVTRGLGLLEGIALTGDPDFDIFRASLPYARRRAASLLMAEARAGAGSSGQDSSSLNPPREGRALLTPRLLLRLLGSFWSGKEQGAANATMAETKTTPTATALARRSTTTHGI